MYLLTTRQQTSKKCFHLRVGRNLERNNGFVEFKFFLNWFCVRVFARVSPLNELRNVNKFIDIRKRSLSTEIKIMDELEKLKSQLKIARDEISNLR